jgi:hypothetical protein
MVTGFIRDASAKADIRLIAWDESKAACGGLNPLSCQL